MLLFTDGIIEAENAADSEWGWTGLQQAVRANLDAPGPALLDLLLARVRTFTGTDEFVDDICLAAVELLGDSGAPPNESADSPSYLTYIFSAAAIYRRRSTTVVPR